MRFIIDRLEGDIAVCEKEDGTFLDINVNKLPSDIKVGDVVRETNAGFSLDKKSTKERKAKINDIMKNMWE